MLRKSISWALTLALLLSCTVFASAESFTVNEYAGDPVLRTMDAAKLDEAKEAVIATLPEDMQDKEFTLTSGGDETGENIALVSTRVCSPDVIQSLIDDGTITESDVDFPDNVTVEVREMTGVMSFVEIDGKYVNAFSSRSIGSSWSADSGWWSDQASSYYTVYGAAYVYFYRYTTSRESGTACRPISFRAKYASSATNPTEMIAIYGHPEVYRVSYPEYLNGTSTSKVELRQYTATGSTNNPAEQTTYTYYTGMDNYCLLTNAYSGPGMNIKLYNGSSLLCSGNVSFNNLQ